MQDESDEFQLFQREIKFLHILQFLDKKVVQGGWTTLLINVCDAYMCTSQGQIFCVVHY